VLNSDRFGGPLVRRTGEADDVQDSDDVSICCSLVCDKPPLTVTVTTALDGAPVSGRSTIVARRRITRSLIETVHYIHSFPVAIEARVGGERIAGYTGYSEVINLMLVWKIALD